MSAHGFKSVFMVGAIATTALACYLVSLRVASERAELESVENKIVLAQRDIRLLNTEIGTRGRLAQLERWNVKVIRLSAPTADQFVESSFQLATLAKPEARPAVEAPLVYASAPAPARRGPVVTNDDGSTAAAPRASRPLGEMMHVAGYARPAARPVSVAARAAITPVSVAPKAATTPVSVAAKAATTPVSVAAKAATRPLSVAPKSARAEIATTKPKASIVAAKTTAAAAKPVKTATADPLGPLSAPRTKAMSDSATASTRSATQPAKESGSR